MTDFYIKLTYNYYENNTYKPEYGDLDVNDEKKGLEILCEDYLWKRNRVNKHSINWNCKFRSKFPCSAEHGYLWRKAIIFE